MKKTTLVFAAALLFSLPALAASPVWEIRSDHSVAYLGGTCHLLRDSDFPLPPGFEEAYQQAGAIVLETDIGMVESPEFHQKMKSFLFYSEGRSLRDDLSPEAYRALKRYCGAVGIPVEALHSMKPPMVVLTLIALELQKLGISTEGADRIYYDRALAEGKRVTGLETVDEQLRFLAIMGQGMEDALVEQSLAELERTGEIFEEIIAAWKNGDEQLLSRILIESTRKDYPEVYRTLFVVRNENWLPKIEELLATPERELILVGAGHLVGPDGLLTALKKKGYRLKQLD